MAQDKHTPGPMTVRDTGGPAFPSSDHLEFGMTLRDWFAGQALAAWPVTDRGGTATDLARKCYTLADAMLAARATGDA